MQRICTYSAQTPIRILLHLVRRDMQKGARAGWRLCVYIAVPYCAVHWSAPVEVIRTRLYPCYPVSTVYSRLSFALATALIRCHSILRIFRIGSAIRARPVSYIYSNHSHSRLYCTDLCTHYLTQSHTPTTCLCCLVPAQDCSSRRWASLRAA